jgi:phosphatidylinositol glycan class N
LIAWGAGVGSPDKANPIGHDDFSKSWNLDDCQRNDVKQADIAPLMAALIGVNYPMNSVGELPIEYLSGDEEFKAASLFTNAKQILAQFLLKSGEDVSYLV